MIFYESYRAAIVQEDDYKERIKWLMKENERLNQYKVNIDDDYNSLKKANIVSRDRNKKLKDEIEKLNDKIVSLQEQLE